MKYGISISGPIHWAITMGKVPGDIASQIQAALAVFRVDGELYEVWHRPAKGNGADRFYSLNGVRYDSLIRAAQATKAEGHRPSPA